MRNWYISAGVVDNRKSSGWPERSAPPLRCWKCRRCSRGRPRPRGHRPRTGAGSSPTRPTPGHSRASVEPPAAMASVSTSRITGTSRSARRPATVAAIRFGLMPARNRASHTYMLPRPATTVWSSRADLIGVILRLQRAGQRFGVELVAQRLRPQRRQQRVAVESVGPGHRHQAESAGVVEPDVGPVVGGQQDMVMRSGRPQVLADGHPARHAEMDDQHLIVVQMDQDVFGAPPDGDDPAAGQPLDHAVGERDAQIGPALLDPGQHPPLHLHGEPAADGFDFRQFGHVAP